MKYKYITLFTFNNMFDNYIDFDEASKEWRKNKKKQENGRFEYVCNYFHKNSKQCRNTIVASLLQNEYVCGFGDNNKYNKYKNHPNKNYYCKKHINRYNPNI